MKIIIGFVCIGNPCCSEREEGSVSEEAFKNRQKIYLPGQENNMIIG